MNYTPITKEHAAHILSVSKRTIDNWLADGTLVKPSSIGRRIYWHPDVFYGWLDKRLGIGGNDCYVPPPKTSLQPIKPVGRPRSTLRKQQS